MKPINSDEFFNSYTMLLKKSRFDPFIVFTGILIILTTFPARILSQSVSGILAGLAIETRSEEISDEAFLKAKMAIIDILGNSMAGYEAPGIPIIRQQFEEWGGKPEASLWFSGKQIPSLSAGFVNSSMAHAMDLDDWHKPSNTHISVVTVPTVLAVGEMTGASGQEILDAIVLGVEVANSIGVQYVEYRKHLHFLPTSIVGGFGATAAACRLMGLSVSQTIHAFGIFYSHASGNRQALYDHTLTKRIQPAIAVKAAIFAASLAGKGFTGPDDIFLSEAGLLRIYAGNLDSLPDPSDFIKKEGSWAIEKLAFKKYACCGASHPVIEASIELSRENNLELKDIESIELFGIFVGSGMVDIPWQQSDSPHVLAQFCAPYGVVSAIRNHAFGPAEITPGRIMEDREVSALAEKVIIKHESEWGGGYPGGQTVRIKTRDGRTLIASHTSAEIFDPEALSIDDIIGKFMANAQFSGMCPDNRSRAIIEAVMSMEEVENIQQFVRNNLVIPGQDK